MQDTTQSIRASSRVSAVMQPSKSRWQHEPRVTLNRSEDIQCIQIEGLEAEPSISILCQNEVVAFVC